jgi:hypothetical protein
VGDGKTYALVEECYMHNFMHGEMLGKRWGLKDDEITGKVALIDAQHRIE